MSNAALTEKRRDDVAVGIAQRGLAGPAAEDAGRATRTRSRSRVGFALGAAIATGAAAAIVATSTVGSRPPAAAPTATKAEWIDVAVAQAEGMRIVLTPAPVRPSN